MAGNAVGHLAAAPRTLISAAVLLGAAATFLTVEGLKIHQDYAAVLACRGGYAACQPVNNVLRHRLGLAMAARRDAGHPGGARDVHRPAVLAGELETGTFRYAWTQGIGRMRWTVAKLGLLAVALTAVTGAISQLYGWFFAPLLSQRTSPRHRDGVRHARVRTPPGR